MLKGIDISSFQSDIRNFNDDVDFVIVKATEGIGYVDKACDSLYQKAKRDRKLLGVYHYARPYLSGNTAEGEAEWFVQNIKGYLNEAILVLDWEAEHKDDTNYAKRFLDRVYALTGTKPLVYASSSTINNYNWKSIVDSDYGLWIAQYGTNNGQPQQEPFTKDWGFYALWQYTSKGRIQGYSSDVDLDYFYGDREMWLKYANSSEKNNNISNRKSVNQVAQEVINGVYGTGSERYTRLVNEGYDYNQIQEEVSKILNSQKKSIDDVAREVIEGKWGNAPERYYRLQQEGYNPSEVQNKVNQMLGTSNARKYTVAYGDTLSDIAQKFNTTVERIVEQNGIRDPNKIYVGEVLNV